MLERVGRWSGGLPYFAMHSRILRTLDDDPRFQTLLGKMKVAWEQFQA